MSNVYLNGDTLPLQQACVPVMDRGFLFGDGIYEVIPVYGGRLFRLQEHLTRLSRSLDAIGIPNPHSDQQWQQILDAMASATKPPSAEQCEQGVDLHPKVTHQLHRKGYHLSLRQVIGC